MDHVVINGKLMRLELAQLPVADRAIIWGDALYEDILLINSIPFRLDAHIDLLAASLALPEIGFSYALNPYRLQRNIATLASRSELYNGLVRVVLTPGVGRVGEEASILLEQGVNEVVFLQKRYYSQEKIEQGLKLDYACYRQVKGDWLARYRIGEGMRGNIALRKVIANGFDEAVITDQDGALLSTTRANIFAVVDGTVITPHITRDGVVNGVMRRLVIETLAREGILLYQESLNSDIMAKASEIFVAGAGVGGVVKVCRLVEKEYRDFSFTEKIIAAIDRRIMAELPAL